ncbi:Histone chaperone asf1 [Ophidiomyces ophidiicola]|uniref:Histone chaperone asf1 n=1 Tax=Ophidiomyces ophidiicola TaxID=1387563 RepID=A0ACB8UVG6_9EURO|nr:Histone chaperone asf1 [Ophidiomyces ophidiicola]KAI1908340.1 Histone chaperone asf1 [Ophidiomyces ophidiicola]KAI1911910.1 Histone chaperone asf1 [Ophidiomyces ophidiicola]KAI1914804.1 Histone chaperone asf1 [Ophidiomyces ophidiicola]KAI1931328.1 Histone chaperone asf1 [Ophidiomyces ophidiicola]KAI1934969.1 Histone chaperone asf1 [Ophidiomyces ophidiicola]
MSVVSLLGVRVLNNPATFTAPYEFEITFECLEQLQKDLEWKLTYVGSATSSEFDQELDSLLVGPIPIGVNKFIFEADPPDLKRIPTSEILGVTVILLTCSYDGREFVRVGYYVNNEYDSEELNEEPPSKPIIERVKRSVLAEKPRVTRFHIKWDSDSDPTDFPPEQPDADVLEDDGAAYGAEEVELEAALHRELEELDKQDDDKMDTGEPVDADDNESEAGSEDLEGETSGSDDEEEEENFGAEDEDVEMGDDSNPPPGQQPQQQSAVMVH